MCGILETPPSLNCSAQHGTFVLACASSNIVVRQLWAWRGSLGVSLPRCAALPWRSGGCSRRSPTPAALWPEQDYLMSPYTKCPMPILSAYALFRHRVLSQENSGVLTGARSGASSFPSGLAILPHVCSIGELLRA